ncbi:hypothetical protein [Streptomyces flavalbus]|uniref:Uncharacterized protein n=1 Tax=Streptomyces flavalbus TaxID=2665155 RepID=A0ABW2WJH1_9ACTN
MIDETPSSQSSTGWPLVTVQSEDALATAAGVLVADDVVFVPHPPARLLTSPKFNVVITSGSTDGKPQEFLGVTDVRLLGLDDGEVQAVLAAFTLAAPSALRRKVPRYSAAELGEAVTRHGGDLWAALASLGYQVPVDADRQATPDAWPTFRALADEGARAVDLHDSVASFASSGCNACGCCLPQHQPPAQGGPRP